MAYGKQWQTTASEKLAPSFQYVVIEKIAHMVKVNAKSQTRCGIRYSYSETMTDTGKEKSCKECYRIR